MGAVPLSGDISKDAVVHRVERSLGVRRICPWEDLPEALRTQLSGAAAAAFQPAGVVYPETQDELAEVMVLAAAEGWSLLPFGSGSKLAWGGLTQPVQLGVSTARLNRVIEHAIGDLTLTAEAGTALSTLVPQLQAQRQCLGFNPAYPQQATLGGAVATADTGWMRQRYGGIRDMLIGVSLVRADGQRAKAGGRVVKNVAGYDLMKLMTGSWGSLAVISEVTFRVYPQSEASKTLVIVGEAHDLDLLLAQILKSGLTPTGLSLINSSPLSHLNHDSASHPGVLVRFQSVTIGVETQADTLIQVAEGLGLSVAIAVDEAEVALWQRLELLRARSPQGTGVTAKVGLLPANAIATLKQLEAMTTVTAAITHVGSGLGWVHLDLQNIGQVAAIRQIYQQQGGFLSIMEAPANWKPNLDIWGYSGGALPLMQRIKQRFDPEGRLSPGRFLL
ncbi:MAG: FAD-binding oxidoreductase [Elainellaceae cyanobacterium]